MRSVLVALVGLVVLAAQGHAFDDDDVRLLNQNNACYQCDLSQIVLSGKILHVARLGNSNLVGARMD
ncbi:MAG: pentapeptide repeat-containing protein, partial [Candidatus Eiseniibacteriota bacterium]